MDDFCFLLVFILEHCFKGYCDQSCLRGSMGKEQKRQREKRRSERERDREENPSAHKYKLTRPSFPSQLPKQRHQRLSNPAFQPNSSSPDCFDVSIVHFIIPFLSSSVSHKRVTQRGAGYIMT